MDFLYRIKTLKFNRFAPYCQVDFPSTHWAWGRLAIWFSAGTLFLGLICPFSLTARQNACKLNKHKGQILHCVQNDKKRLFVIIEKPLRLCSGQALATKDLFFGHMPSSPRPIISPFPFGLPAISAGSQSRHIQCLSLPVGLGQSE